MKRMLLDHAFLRKRINAERGFSLGIWPDATGAKTNRSATECLAARERKGGLQKEGIYLKERRELKEISQEFHSSSLRSLGTLR